tara:strand:- start:203 stop:421 length:219 start_codon:yes stop_codon:yes gene_type:complete
MNTLDLHGTRHDSVENIVTNFVLLNDMPVKIITGKSPRMIEIVHLILDKYNLEYYPENFINHGAYIIRDKTK